MKKAIWLMVPLIICLSGPVSADFYKYTDQDGNIRFTDDLSKVPKDQRTNVTSYEESESAQPTAVPVDKKETGQQPIEKKPETDNDTDAQSKQIQSRKDELDKEYHALMREKARLEAEAENPKSAEEIVQFNRKVSDLNKNISQYDQKRKALHADIEAYNARVAENNKKNK